MRTWGFCGGSDSGQSTIVNGERTINLMPELQQAPGALGSITPIAYRPE